MNRLLLSCVLLAVGAASAWANIIITLDDPSQTGTPGGTLSYTGILSNTGLTTVFLNSANLNLAGSSFTPDFINPFFNNVPFFLDAGQFTASIELFSVLVNNPFLDPNGAYVGSYTLLGGVDSGSQDILASAVLTVNVGATAVPEPNTFPVMAAALVGLLAWAGVAKARSLKRSA